MTTLMFTAEDELVEQAEAAVQRRHTSLEEALRESLRALAAEDSVAGAPLEAQVAAPKTPSPEERKAEWSAMMRKLSYARSTGPYKL